jgi:hypothetical protein
LPRKERQSLSPVAESYKQFLINRRDDVGALFLNPEENPDMNNYDPYDYHEIDGRVLSEAQVLARDEALIQGTWWELHHDGGNVDALISNVLQNGWEYDSERHKCFWFKKRKPLPRGRFVRSWWPF